MTVIGSDRQGAANDLLFSQLEGASSGTRSRARRLMHMDEPPKSRTHDRFFGQPRSVALLPVIGAVFIAFLVTGMAMPVLPLHVHQGLGYGAFPVGLVAGRHVGAAHL